MSELMILLSVVVVLVVLRSLGAFGSVVQLTQVATRETAAYNRLHKVKTAEVYQNATTNIDVVKVNENIELIDSMNFD